MHLFSSCAGSSVSGAESFSSSSFLLVSFRLLSSWETKSFSATHFLLFDDFFGLNSKSLRSKIFLSTMKINMNVFILIICFKKSPGDLLRNFIFLSSWRSFLFYFLWCFFFFYCFFGFLKTLQ